MIEHQRVIDEIRFQLQSDYCQLTDQLRQLAADYAEACRDVNARLRQCGEYLKQGLRSEAINLADTEPNLLDLVALLDVPEKQEWDDVVGMYDLPKADPLLLHVAESLNESYSTEQPLQKLLDRHRLLALTGAPLVERLTILRKLRDQDPESAFWPEDVDQYEKARLQELQADAEAAAERNDANALTVLLDEVQDPGWQQPPSPGLVKHVKRLAGRMQRNDALEELPQLELELNEAFTELDIIRARELKRLWNTAAKQAKLPADDPAAERVAPILAWVADEDAYEQADQEFQVAAQALERKLDGDASLAELQRLGREVDKHGLEWPEILATRYTQRVESLRKGEKRRRQIIVGTSVATLLGVVLFVFFLVNASQRTAEEKRIAQNAQELIDEGQLAEARELLEAHSELSSSDPWLEANKNLTAAENAETSRQAELQEALESVEAATRYAIASRSLERAKELAKTPEENIKISRLERDWQLRQQKAEEERDAAFLKQVELVSKDIKQVELLVGNAEKQEELGELLAQAQENMRPLIDEIITVSTPLASQAKLLESRIAELERTNRKALAKAKLLRRLTETSFVDPTGSRRQVDDYADSLTRFTKSYADDSRVSAFQKSIAETDAWRAGVEYASLKHIADQFEPRTFQEVKDRIQACNRYLEDHKGSPHANQVRDYLAYLGPILARKEGPDGDSEDSIESKIVDLYSGPLMENVHVIKSRSGEVYYLKSEARFETKLQASFKYVVGFDGTTRGLATKTDQLASKSSVPAPQVKIAEAVRRQPRQWMTNVKGWQPYFKDLTATIGATKELDPILRYLLLLRTLEYAAQGSQPVAKALAVPIGQLSRAKVDATARWMEPRDEDVAKHRREAAKTLSDLGDLKTYWEKATTERDKLAARCAAVHHTVGWLSKSAIGEWKCRSNWEPVEGYELKVAVPDGAGTYRWQTIGRTDKGSLSLSASSRSAFQEGRLVFAFAVDK